MVGVEFHEYGVVDAQTGSITVRPIAPGLIAWINPGSPTEVLAVWTGARWTHHRRSQAFGRGQITTFSLSESVLCEILHDPVGPAPEPGARLVSPGHFQRLGGAR